MQKILFFIIFMAFAFICNSYKFDRHEQDYFQYDYDLRTPNITKKNILISEYFEMLYKQAGFNGNVLVAKGSEIIYTDSRGFADYENKQYLDLYSIFQIGSVSKQFTAYAIMVLNQRGLLKYTDEIQTFFPEFPYNGITVHHLLSHRSGLPNYMYFCDEFAPGVSSFTNDSVLNIMFKHKPQPYFSPDYRFNYSNTGYLLLASIVEKLTGTTFEDFMHDEIFMPLGMKNTFVYNMTRDDIKHYKKPAVSYMHRWYIAQDINLDGTTGDKNVYTTLEDMFKWSLALKTEKLISDDRLDEAFTPWSTDIRHGSNYGYGWRIKHINDSKLVYHAGWWRGNNAIFIKDLKTDYTIIALSNINNGLMLNIFNNMVAILGIGSDTVDNIL